MRKGPVITIALVLFVAATAVLVHLGRDVVTPIAAAPRDNAPVSTTPTTAAPETAPDRAASNVPLTALRPGDTPPQFVLFSLDGAGSHDIWQRFLDAADTAGARFTAFLTGLNLVGDEHRDAYTGPGHARGKAATSFGGTADDLAREVADLNAAYAAGHEIGTHYNGHFCDGNPPSGNDWTAADWRAELDQFFTFVDTFAEINAPAKLQALAFGSDDITGGRTPCLEGDLDELEPVWAARGMSYDSSKNLYAGIGWPERLAGVWEFQIPYAYSPAFDRKITVMDYNMWATFNGAADEPDRTDELRAAVRQTYDYLFDQVYSGNRAPLVIETHANEWNGDSFVPPALDFMADVCVKKDVICATHADVVAWLEAQDAKVLAQLQRLPVVAAGP